ncbi:MAG: hypothetical protein NTZ74_00895 [Chloroflexi bacterium]|nr:hypothetical protein [Chloroflexota bacterium]
MVQKKKSRAGHLGQSLLEYSLILVLIAIILITVLVATGNIVTQKLDINLTPAIPSLEGTPTVEPVTNAQILQDMFSRISTFYELNNRWPRTWSPYNFTDLNLNPTDYSQAINGLYWSPSGAYVKIANNIGDNYQVYARGLDGTMRHLYDGWAIFCSSTSSTCYFHSVAPGNEIDFSSIVATTP